MLEAFVVTLREGVEAALVICLILGYLRKTGRQDLERSLAWGVGLALLLSLAGAVGVKATGFDPEGRAEGIVLAVSAVLVAWLVVWMWVHGKKLKQLTEQRLGEILQRPSGGQKAGIFLFSFFVIFREGVETVLLLSAVNVTTDAILAFAGGVAGIILALAFGIAFYKGSLRVDLRKFFFVTTLVLLVFVAQLVVSSLHEFAEAGDLPSGAEYMRIAGPLIRNNLLFVLAILALPFLLMLGTSFRSSAPANPAEERKERAAVRGQRLARGVFSVLAVLFIGTLGWAYSRERGELTMDPPVLLESQDGAVRVSRATLEDKKLHRYVVVIEGKLVRFLAMKLGEDRFATAFDACLICKDMGYVQQGDRLICRNCVADINVPTLGDGGGCNPVPLASTLFGDAVVVKLEDLRARKDLFLHLAFDTICPVCRMRFPLAEAGGAVDGVPHCAMKQCREELQRRK